MLPTPSIATSPDHRIFGYDQRGQIRVSIYNGAHVPDSGALYTWIVGTFGQLEAKLESWYEQLTSEESEVLEELEAANDAYEIECDDCGGTGIDPGGLSAFEPEECPVCHGAKRITLASLFASEEDEPAKRIPAVAVSVRKERVA